MNKFISKGIFLENKILTPKYVTLKSMKNESHLKELLTKKINFPVVIKPVNEGSSLGVKISKNLKELVKFTKLLLKKYDSFNDRTFFYWRTRNTSCCN